MEAEKIITYQYSEDKKYYCPSCADLSLVKMIPYTAEFFSSDIFVDDLSIKCARCGKKIL